MQKYSAFSFQDPYQGKKLCDDFDKIYRQYVNDLSKANSHWDFYLSNYNQRGKTPKEWSAFFKANRWVSETGFTDFLLMRDWSLKDILTLSLECKVIPKNMLSKLEALYKALVSRRKTSSIRDFFITHYDAIQGLLKSNTWPNVGDSEDAKVGSFTLANQTKADPAAVIKTLGLAERLIRQSDIPNVKSVLYGPVIIATKLKGEANVMAFYSPQQDTIYIQALKSYSHVVEKTLLHEIGHRYFNKFAKAESKREWREHDVQVGKKTRALEIGDLIYDSGKEYEFYEKTLHGSKLYAALRDPVSKEPNGYIDYKEATRGTAYPTAYSATNFEEHFCEAFSMYLLGTLQPEHFAAFERIWVR
jgi:hypothetical protein